MTTKTMKDSIRIIKSMMEMHDIATSDTNTNGINNIDSDEGGRPDIQVDDGRRSSSVN